MQPPVESSLTWKKPGNGRVKINVDAAFDNTDNKTGFGVCIRNDQGNFMLARTTIFILTLLPHEGEAIRFSRLFFGRKVRICGMLILNLIVSLQWIV